MSKLSPFRYFKTSPQIIRFCGDAARPFPCVSATSEICCASAARVPSCRESRDATDERAMDSMTWAGIALGKGRPFVKMHGLRNGLVIVDGRDAPYAPIGA